jgi:p24 family protein delta-1
MPKCIWNAAHKNALIVVTANVGPGKGQRVDVEIRDRQGDGNVYLSKKDIKGETRLAVTAHAEGDVGVCFTNTIDPCELWPSMLTNMAPMLIL